MCLYLLPHDAMHSTVYAVSTGHVHVLCNIHKYVMCLYLLPHDAMHSTVYAVSTGHVHLLCLNG